MFHCGKNIPGCDDSHNDNTFKHQKSHRFIWFHNVDVLCFSYDSFVGNEEKQA